MILWFTSAFAFTLICIVWALVTIGFWFTFGIIFTLLASLLSGIVVLTTWATGRRVT
jgi:hypothetical protein